MHKLYLTKAGGGRRELKLGALHKRGAAYERRHERGTRGIRRAEGHSERDVGWGIFCNDGYSSATGTTCNCVCPHGRRRGKFGGHSSGRKFFRLHYDDKRRQGRISPLSRWIDDNLPSAHEQSILRSFCLTAEAAL